MDIDPWRFAIGAACSLITAPPAYIYHILSSAYRRHTRVVNARTHLPKALELERQTREEANSSHGFMQLPGEIRNHIYSLCMVSEAVLDPVWGAMHVLQQIDETKSYLVRSSFYPCYTGQLHPEHPFEPSELTWARMASMSQVCRVWRTEALQHFYGTNVFKLPTGKHLHERWNPPQRVWYAVWATSYWHRTVISPAGRFARRNHYVPWVRQRPVEAFPVLRLVLHDYSHCPHWVQQHWAQTLQGGCMILLDFEKRVVRAVRGVDERDAFNLWNCDLCWKRFGEIASRLNRNEEMGKLFAEFESKMDAESAIKVVDGVRRGMHDCLEILSTVTWR